MALERLRPREGWRQFAGEVGVIVLGVMIALAAQQAADEWRWSREVARTKADLDNEILNNAAIGAERVALNRCLTGRLAELSKKIVANNGRWTGDPFFTGPEAKGEGMSRAVPITYRVPSRSFTSDAWEQAKSTGILLHMAPEEVTLYSAIYEQVVELRGLNREEWRAAPSLSFLAFDGSLDSDLRERALSRVATLDSYYGLMVLVAKQVASAAEQLEGRLSAATLNDTRDRLQRQRALRGACVDAAAAAAVLRPLMRE